MNAPVSRWGIVEAVSPVASYFAESQAPAVPTHAQTPTTFGRRVVDAIAYAVSWPRRRMAMAELSSLTDRELADIGLTRSELRQVFRRDFAADRRSARL